MVSAKTMFSQVNENSVACNGNGAEFDHGIDHHVTLLMVKETMGGDDQGVGE